MNPDDSFADVVRQVKQVTLEAYEHQLYPFEDFVEKLQIPRERDRVVLSKIRIDAKDFVPGMDFEVEELKVKSLIDQLSYPEIYKEDLYFCFTRYEKRIKAEIEYYPDMYDHSRMRLMKERYIDLMGKLLNNEEAGISGIDYTTTDEKQPDEDLDISFNI
jgi:non-ribosomal peptide synthetase component F